jgi:hypothetical protein
MKKTMKALTNDMYDLYEDLKNDKVGHSEANLRIKISKVIISANRTQAQYDKNHNKSNATIEFMER